MNLQQAISILRINSIKYFKNLPVATIRIIRIFNNLIFQIF